MPQETLSQIEEWKRRLVDLSRRNRLLYFKQTTSSTVRVEAPGLDEVFDRLVVEELPWRFFSPPESANEVFDFDPALNHESAPTATSAKEARRPNELLTSFQDSRKLEKTLVNLYRRSEADFAERGIRILQAAFGMLEWQAKDGSETIISPLILVPSILVRNSDNTLPSLKKAEDDVVLNPALEVKLRQDFRIDLPSPPDDWEQGKLSEYLQLLQDAVAQRKWKVVFENWIGLLSFHKLVMYKDLDVHKQRISEHTVITALAGEGPSLVSDPSAVPAQDELDRKTDPKDSFTILDADSSQLACIEAVKRGQNLLIHGPPGTGKSQTISNIIAESIAAGRKVLFVSEKMAALEVVFNRLKEKGLGHYCLEVHSAKAKRQEVVAELARTMGRSVRGRSWLSELELTQLRERRAALNEYARALHMQRSPLQRTVFQVLGELTALRDLPYVSMDELKPGEINPARYHAFIELSSRAENTWRIALNNSALPWFGYKSRRLTLSDKESIREKIRQARGATLDLSKEIRQTSTQLGLSESRDVQHTEWLLGLIALLVDCPGVPRQWLEGDNAAQFPRLAEEYTALHQRASELRSSLQAKVKPEFFAIEGSLRNDLATSIARSSQLLARHPESEIGSAPAFAWLLAVVEDACDHLRVCQNEYEFIRSQLGIPTAPTIASVGIVEQLCESCLSAHRPDKRWFERQVTARVRGIVREIRPILTERNDIRNRVSQEYDSRIFSLPAQSLLDEIRRRFATGLRWLKPAYHRHRRLMKAIRLDGSFPHGILETLRQVAKMQELEHDVDSASDRAGEILGDWYQKYATDWEAVDHALIVVQKVQDACGGSIPPQTAALASLSDSPSPEFRRAYERLREAIGLLTTVLERGKDALPCLSPRILGVPLSEVEFAQIGTLLEAIRSELTTISNAIGSVSARLIRSQEPAIQDVDSLLADLEALRELDACLESRDERMKGVFAARFKGGSTDWKEVVSALAWVGRLLCHFGGADIPQETVAIIELPPGCELGGKVLREHLALVELRVEDLRALFQEGRAIGGLDLHERSFTDVIDLLQQLEDTIEDIEDVCEYYCVRDEFTRRGLSRYLDRLIQARCPGCDLPSVMRRSILQAWLDWIFASDDRLGRFRSDQQELLLREFKALDRKLWINGCHHVVEAANQHRKADLTPVPGGETGILHREINKKKRHMPIRRLFENIPGLLQELKPCMLMSPISVSQFLDPEKVSFDLLVFDEASQIKTEDAVASVYRCHQVVICGDEKQLPPTTFFEQGISDELDDEASEEVFDEFESVIKACASIGISSRSLRWHYRSRHESLIAFSNKRFYSDQPLITFPSARAADDDLGVKFCFVPDGVYDRGGSKRNEREATVVVDVVRAHLVERPSKTIGVVTFSIAQKEAIEDRMDELSKQHPELRPLLQEDRLQGFFVKNLESVQGDERDVMIFSVGYARDPLGRLTMHFGPLNREGGERRLNVAVTRAREKVIVVSSIRAGDFDLTAVLPAGVLALQRYLDYAENGEKTLELTAPLGGEAESPLESDVASAIRSMGFDVVFQVGCSEYRIDIGVLDPGAPGRYILGVECDGATYHSSAVARDRDRLRQEVLEGLGWKIHRIWSPDWLRRREREIVRLKAAIETALEWSRQTSVPLPGSAAIFPGPAAVQVEQVKKASSVWSADSDDAAEIPLPPWASRYKAYSRSERKATGREFHDPDAGELREELLGQIVAVEGPVHIDFAARRMAKSWGIERVGSRVMSAFDETVRRLKAQGTLRTQGSYLFSSSDDGKVKVRVPDPNDNETFRPVQYIPRGEIAVAIERAAEDAFSISAEDLLRYVARLFGFGRTGTQIRERLAAILGELCSSGELVREGDKISSPRAGCP